LSYLEKFQYGLGVREHQRITVTVRCDDNGMVAIQKNVHVLKRAIPKYVGVKKSDALGFLKKYIIYTNNIK
jgi:hypothetical protein